MARFDELPLLTELLESLEKQVFVEPFPIQEQAIPVALEGKDIIGIADTGTGKTVAFSLPMIQSINPNANDVQGLVVCPTRELAMQVADVIRKLSKYIPELQVATIYGGQKIETQLRQLKKGVHIVVGTPGRILDHIRQKSLSLNEIKMVVLDEADEMLSMGFRQDMEKILKETPEHRQTLLFSATMSNDIMRLTKRYQNDPVTIKVESNTNYAESLITHTFFKVEPHERTESLAYLLREHNPQQAIIFCNTRRRVKKVGEQLEALGIKSEMLHGDVRQSARNRILEGFRSGKTKVVIATDIAARGIDVANIEAVFHYELPEDTESYVHRSGRTGRAGKEGKAFSFACRGDMQQIGRIEHGTGVLFNKGTLPSKEERQEGQVLKSLADLSETVINKNLDGYVKAIEKHLNDVEYTAADIAAALLHAKLNVKPKSDGDSLSDGRPRRSRSGSGDRRRSGSGDRRRSDSGDRRSSDRRRSGFGDSRRSESGDRRDSGERRNSGSGRKRESGEGGYRREYGSSDRERGGRSSGGFRGRSMSKGRSKSSDKRS